MKFFTNRYAKYLHKKDRVFIALIEMEARNQDEDTIKLYNREYFHREELLDAYVKNNKYRAKFETWLLQRKRIKE